MNEDDISAIVSGVMPPIQERLKAMDARVSDFEAAERKRPPIDEVVRSEMQKSAPTLFLAPIEAAVCVLGKAVAAPKGWEIPSFVYG